MESESEMEAIWNKQYKLSEFTDPQGGRFKTYDELKTKMHRVLGLSGSVSDSIVAEDVKLPWEGKPQFESKESETISSTEVNDKFSVEDNTSEDTLSYFQNLADKKV